MKKHLLLLAASALPLFSSFPAFGQSAFDLAPVYQHIAERYGLDQQAIGALAVKSSHVSAHNQVQHVYLVQTHDGIEVRGTHISLAVLPGGRIVSADHRLVKRGHIRITNDKAVITAGDAIAGAATSLGMALRSAPGFLRYNHAGIAVYDRADISLQDIPVETVFFAMPSGEYRLAYAAQIESVETGELYLSYVDAATGQAVAHESLTVHCRFEEGYLGHHDTCQAEHSHYRGVQNHSEAYSPPSSQPSSASGQYRVLPVIIESPNHGDFELVANAHDVSASPYGWHDTNGADGAEFTHTRGNNVHAFLDRNWDFSSDYAVDGGAGLLFDFAYDGQAEPDALQDAAATNLFFRNNVMHDFSHAYGFTEVAGNFQQTNYTGAGAGGDYVNAHAQFGANNTVQCGTEANNGTECINNANFSTPSDGSNPRMRMFIWNADFSGRNLDVIEPVELAGKIVTGAADFGPPITEVPVTGTVLIANDGTPDGSYGCGQLQPELAGKIALIDRGICEFGRKVLNAQQAGAIAAIICNFEDATIGMAPGVVGGQVTIPSVMIGSVDCARIRLHAGQGLVVSLVAPDAGGGPQSRDASFDNGIIAHEYGHGISNRLTGGGGCLGGEEARSMGEGWSDFFGLVTTVRPGEWGDMARGVGTYSAKEQVNGRGIRTYPYSTDMGVNPHTFDATQGEAVPHGVGSVWAVMLWDLYWAFSDAYGWDPDLYHGTGGNNIAIQLVMDGLKLQPCNPGFINARDAILLADSINNGGANSCLIWNVFARRGLGVNAKGGSASSAADGQEGFETHFSCLDEVRIGKSMTPEVIAGENIEVTLRVTNYKDFSLTNVVVEDLVPAGCTYLPGSANIEPATGTSLVWTIPTLGRDEELVITYLLKTDITRNSVRLYYDDIEGFPDERWDIGYDTELNGSNFWQTQTGLVHSGDQAWGVDNVEVASDHWLINFDAYTITGANPLLRFYHYYNTEPGFDGGFLEITRDNGASWRMLEPYVFRNKYPGRLNYGTIPIPNLYAYSGVSSETFEMIPVYAELSAYKGEQVKIRFRFVTDAEVGGAGWYIDDPEIMDGVMYNSTVCVTSDETNAVCAEAPSRGTIVDTQVASSIAGDLLPHHFAILPNPAGEMVQIVMTAEKSGRADVRIFSLTGVMLKAGVWDVTEGLNQKTFDVSGLAPGMYVVQIRTASGFRSEKFIKE